MLKEINVDRIRVSKGVLDGLEAVRESGMTNMLDRPVVIELAKQMGFEETARWIETHPRDYAEGVFRGFEAEGGDE